MSTTVNESLANLVRGFSVETTPNAAKKIKNFLELISPGTAVYVTLLPGSDMADTLETCKLLANQDLVPVPHFAARQIRDRRELENSLKRFRDETGSTQVLAIAGGSSKPVGEFHSSMQLLETGLFDKAGIERIGIAGHPEGSPDISDKDIESALLWKDQFAERSDANFHLVTQFCFQAQPVIDWVERISKLGIAMPIHLGVPGLASLAALIKHATMCGIGPSMQILRKQSKNAARLIQTATPDKLLADIAKHRFNRPDFPISDIHVYPLGGLRKSAEWFRNIENGTTAINMSESAARRSA